MNPELSGKVVVDPETAPIRSAARSPSLLKRERTVTYMNVTRVKIKMKLEQYNEK